MMILWTVAECAWVAYTRAPVCRCVRPDQSSATVRLHYLKDGNVNFAFTINRAEYFIPVAFLLKAFAEVRVPLATPNCVCLLISCATPNCVWLMDWPLRVSAG